MADGGDLGPGPSGELFIPVQTKSLANKYKDLYPDQFIQHTHIATPNGKRVFAQDVPSLCQAVVKLLQEKEGGTVYLGVLSNGRVTGDQICPAKLEEVRKQIDDELFRIKVRTDAVNSMLVPVSVISGDHIAGTAKSVLVVHISALKPWGQPDAPVEVRMDPANYSNRLPEALSAINKQVLQGKRKDLLVQARYTATKKVSDISNKLEDVIRKLESSTKQADLQIERLQGNQDCPCPKPLTPEKRTA